MELFLKPEYMYIYWQLCPVLSKTAREYSYPRSNGTVPPMTTELPIDLLR